MSYPRIEDKDFLENLLRRKEFYSLRNDSARNFRDPPGEAPDPFIGKYLKIHSHQLFIRNFLNPNTSYKRLLLMHSTGSGKCLGFNTPILMYNGSVKLVQDIIVGDKLMGDNSTPRNVLSLARGRETMYKFIPLEGDSHIFNESHILSLRTTEEFAERVNMPQYLDISILDYLKLGEGIRANYLAYHVGVDFPAKPLDIDPYMLGYWLGGEDSSTSNITFQDTTVLNYFRKEVARFGGHMQHRSGYEYIITNSEHDDKMGCDGFLACLQKYNLLRDKHVPDDYKINSRENRLKLLAGLIDSVGVYRNGCYSFIQKSERLADDVVYLCRSLGFTLYVGLVCMSTYPDTHYEISISGDGLDEIPVLIAAKAQFGEQIRGAIGTKFVLEKLPENDYYGFEIDGNHRFLLGDFLVTHNTLGAISIAQEFIKVYRRMYQTMAIKMQGGKRNYAEIDRNTPTIFVLGFGGTQAAFRRELLRHPELGFISLSEKEELIKRQKIADAGLPDDVRSLKEYYNHLKKRITNKTKDGFYKFFGYQEFVNRLFLSDEIKLTDLEAIAIQKLRSGENTTLEDIIHEYIENGKIQVNYQLLEQFKDSLLICDEIHNTYNMNMKNNYGVAIQFVLDSIPSLRAVFMSATPVNNSPTEIVEVLNYLVPPDKKITKKEFFVNNRTLHPGKLEQIGELSSGRVSFLQDINIKYFPKRIFTGETDKLSREIDGVTEIPYLKFYKCPMSPLHQITYNNYLKSIANGENRANSPQETNHAPTSERHHTAQSDEEAFDILDETEDLSPAELRQMEESADEDQISIQPAIEFQSDYSYHNIPTDGYAIYDIVFPSPDGTGVFRSSETRNKISMGDQSWKDKVGIQIKKFSALNNLITGDFLQRGNIAEYSTKLAAIIDILEETFKSPNGEKVMIYHDRVKMSGVLLIQELLRMNNYLDEFSEPVETTKCAICGRQMGEHLGGSGLKKSTEHVFRPARFIMAHSDIDKASMDQSLAKFNSPDNAHGHNYKILVGSKIIKESYDFKDVQNLIVMTLPTNIPTLIQVFGRCVRKNSHINLPPEQRRVKVYMLISTVNLDVEHLDDISPEEYRYIDKLNDYIAIQRIEREFNRNAVDADIHRDIIMPEELYKIYFPEGTTNGPEATIGNLYFEPSFKLPNEYTLDELNLSTFTAYKYYEEEIRTISYIIKRLFMRQQVWIYDDLWAKVREPPFGVETNPKLFSENNFIIALNNLVSPAADIIDVNKPKVSGEISEIYLVERLFDYNDRYIYLEGDKNKIQQIGQYYILFPVSGVPSSPLSVVYTEYLESSRESHALYKSRGMSTKEIIKTVKTDERIVADVESYIRRISYKPGVRINIDSYVKESKAEFNYEAKKKQFVAKYSDKDDIMGFLSEYTEEFYMSLIEETIVGGLMGTCDALGRKVIGLLDRFKVIIYIGEVKKYKDTSKQFKLGLPAISDNTPIGYLTSKSIRLFDPQLADLSKKKSAIRDSGRWIEVSKVALNRQINYKENDNIVGYFEAIEDHMKFKLRKPLQSIRREVSEESTQSRLQRGDTRLIERGIVCGTKNKHELLQIIASLGVSIGKLDRSQIRIKKLCEIIKNKLLELEIRERQKDSKVKYVYLFWDELPQLT